MPYAQYTRNFEDVMLCRALQGIERGCFVDVGANHPVVDSNTYALYERGWRGIAVEPQAAYAGPWQQLRPQDVFLAVAAGASVGETRFFHVPQNGQMGTSTAASAESYREQGLQVIEQRATMMTLTGILEAHLGGRELHLLSIDVEGGERDVLLGMDFSRYRPWIMIVEAVRPGTPVPSHETWERMLRAARYEPVYFDGVNRFYVAQERSDLERHFALPPNVWDDFVAHRVVTLERELAEEKERNRQLL